MPKTKKKGSVQKEKKIKSTESNTSHWSRTVTKPFTKSAEWLGMLVFARQARRRRRRRLIIRTTAAALILSIAVFSYLTNPFVRLSIVIDPYTEIKKTGQTFELAPNSNVLVQDDAFFRSVAQLKSSWHIFASYFSGGKKAKQASVDEIIREIHEIRFDPDNPFLISGDHFSVLYPRSLGIFYHSILDPRTALSQEDWENREHLYLKTTAYALMVYEGSDRLSTTIVPVGPRSVALMNIYAPPSDTLYSLLYALVAMQDEAYLANRYPFEDADQVSETPLLLTTDQAAQELVDQYRDTLVRHYESFLRDVVDPATGLVKKDILLSGTKDIVKRQSSFYDNVMVWKTKQLMMALGLIEDNPAELDALKQQIVSSFWLEPEGYFLDQLDPISVEEKHYSSDWIVAYQTGFLNPDNLDDRDKLQKVIGYIQRNALDQPFGLQYHADRRDYQLHGIVKFAAPTYGSTTIWSHWGMEYTKLLAHMALVSGDTLYLEQADRQLAAYTYNIKRYRGYPEVYDAQGDFFRTMFYKSIRRTGWVVNYEQAREMTDWARSELFPNGNGQVRGLLVEKKTGSELEI